MEKKMIKEKVSIWKRIGFALCLGLMIGFVACDDEDDTVQLFNQDRLFTDFSSANVYGTWDLDNDGFLDEDEFTSSYYEIWDLDDDGILEENEWDTAVTDFNIVGADWNAWDLDANGRLDMNEFKTGFSSFNYFTDWDMDNDGLIRDREYTDGVFDLWDVDGDGVLAEADYSNWFNRYFGV